ncbi:sulfurtransferase [Flammeovirgaceae bacterium SG7u.111]|nr:sulfurtransferase [Flammeovirgaceae bacterium SG7u.132]WPO34272.1 sulfurtransferase [Flammeovirgaceae bacterium SG7u.111]
MDSIVSIEWLSANIDDPDLIILDATQDGSKSGLVTEYPGLQIKGARFFDLKNSFSDKSTSVPNMLQSPEEFAVACRKLGISKSSKIVAYDNLGIYTSPRVWWMFNIMGHKNVAVLDGGLPEWIKNGLTTEPFTEEGTFEEGDFIATFSPEMVRDAKGILKNIDSGEELVVDARGKGRFDGTVPEPRAGMKSGHIPKSVNLPFKKVLKDGKLLPKEELEKVIGELDLGNKPLVFSCGSGITASVIMLACAQVMENKMALYDGSWSEWGLLEGAPVDVA